jgi:uncharacterized membrane protein
MMTQISRWILGIFFVAAGLNHFRSPAVYLSIMPWYLPWHLELVYLSGVAEVAGGVGVLIPRIRVMAGWGLIALLLAVFPANIQAALHGMELGGHPVSRWILWARLPLQPVLIAWVYWACVRGRGGIGRRIGGPGPGADQASRSSRPATQNRALRARPALPPA